MLSKTGSPLRDSLRNVQIIIILISSVHAFTPYALYFLQSVFTLIKIKTHVTVFAVTQIVMKNMFLEYIIPNIASHFYKIFLMLESKHVL